MIYLMWSEYPAIRLLVITFVVACVILQVAVIINAVRDPEGRRGHYSQHSPDRL